MPNNNGQSIEFRDAAIQDMLGRPPGWLLRSGLSVIALSLVVVLGIAAVVRYPERVEAPFVLQTETLPLAVNTDAKNYVEAMLVDDGGNVKAGDTLLVLRSDGDWRAVSGIHEYLDRVNENLEQFEPLPPLRYPSRISALVGTLNSAIRTYRGFHTSNGTTSRIATLQDEIEQTEYFISSLNRQIALYNDSLDYEDSYTQQPQRIVQDSLSGVQMVKSIKEMTTEDGRQRELLVTKKHQYRIRTNQLKRQILELRLENQKQEIEVKQLLLSQRERLRRAVDQFSFQHFIVAHDSGIINWVPEIQEGAMVEGSMPLGYIIPENTGSKKIARLKLPTTGAGRLKIGNQVILNLDAYPSREYGQLTGTLISVDAMALPNHNHQYSRYATVALPNILVTSYQTRIPFQHNLTGTARIITRKRTLLQRLGDRVFSITQNQ